MKPSFTALIRGITTKPKQTKPGAFNRHITHTCEDDRYEYYLHATKGWRRRAKRNED